MKILLGSLLAFTAHALPVFDKDFPCTTNAKANQYVTDFKIDLASFGGNELCDSNVDSKKLLNDLSLVEEGEFTGTVTNVFINDKVPRDSYYTWLKQQTFGVRRGNDVPAATAYNRGGFFTMQDGWAKLSTLGRVGVVIHEARHTEGYFHTQCEHGPYSASSTSGCDDSVPEGGAHAIEMEYYSRVALQGKNFNPVYQSMARMMTTARSNFVFNQNPMVEKEGLVAINDNAIIALLNNQKLQIPLFQKVNSTSRLKRTSFGVSLFNADQTAEAIDLTDGSPAARIDDDYSYFKLLKLNGSSGGAMEDLEEFDVGVRRYLVGFNAHGDLFGYIFEDAIWQRGSTLTGLKRLATRAPDGRAGLFGLTADGQFCEIDPQQLNCVGSFKPWPQGVEKFVKNQAQLLELNQGQLLDASTHQSFTQLNEPVRDVVEAPTYNVFE